MHGLERTACAFALFIVMSAAALAQPAASETPAQESPGAAQARALAQMLQDPEAREALVQRLLEVAEGAGTSAPEAPPEPGLVQVLAQKSKAAAETLAGMVTATTDVLADLGSMFEADSQDALSKAGTVARDLAVLVVVTLVLFFVLRLIATYLYARMARQASDARWLRTLGLLMLSSLIDALTAVGAWAGGYGFALAFGDQGAMDLPQSLFLNAFLAIELVKVALRAVLAPRYPALRMLPMSDESAGYWGFWISRLVSLLGYGLLLAVPIVDARVSPGAGRALAVLVAITALVIAVLMVLQNRRTVRDALRARARRAQGRVESALLGVFARTWHLAAIIYLLALFAVWVTQPEAGLQFMLLATLQSAVAVVIGILVTGFIGRWVSAGMHLSEDLRERLPLLEQRLNAYVPAILKVVRLVVMAAVALAMAQIWGVADFLAWLEDEAGRVVVLRVLSACVIALVALGMYLAVSSWVEYRLNPNFGTVPTARERTLLALFRNAFSIALGVITVMLVLAQLGVNIGPLLAGAGVLGLAIGFGAQKLVQDVITGAFIQFENAMNEGDVVTAGGITGVVERLTVRSAGLRSLDGVYHVIPFSSVDSVSNFMKGFSFHVAEIGVAYRENVAQVKELMHEAFDRLQQTEHGEQIIAPLEMHGLTQFGDSAVMVRARIKCLPGSQWALGRAYNEIIKEIFDDRGVEIPFPHVTVYMGEDKDGKAPPLRIEGGAPVRDGAAAPEPAAPEPAANHGKDTSA
jgi:small conductance mechanosensitive channel